MKHLIQLLALIFFFAMPDSLRAEVLPTTLLQILQDFNEDGANAEVKYSLKTIFLYNSVINHIELGANKTYLIILDVPNAEKHLKSSPRLQAVCIIKALHDFPEIENTVKNYRIGDMRTFHAQLLSRDDVFPFFYCTDAAIAETIYRRLDNYEFTN
jgi:hypothetical protein